MGVVDGNCRVEIYIHLLDLTRKNSCEKGPKVEIFAAVPGQV
jgi:hypothetical protein